MARTARPSPAVSDPRRLTLGLGLNQLLSWATSFYAPAVITSAAAAELELPSAQLMGGFSAALLVAGVCAPRIGRWIDRQGGRGPLAASTLVLAAGLTCLAGAQGLASWYAGWGLLGLGMALGLYDAAFATAGRLLGLSAGPVITGITLIAGFASTLGWPLGMALLPQLGWRGLLLAYAGLQLLVNLPLVLACLPRGLPPPVPKPTAAPGPAPGRLSAASVMLACLAGFFTLRWFMTSAIAAHILPLIGGLGLEGGQAMLAAMLIGPGQVLGRLLEWRLAGRIGPLARARLGALLFPLGAPLLLLGGPAGICGFMLLYGMSNGILTVNRGSLPLLVCGPAGYAARLGWLAVPVLLAQAVAPTLAAPAVSALPAGAMLLACCGVAGVATLLLLPLKAWKAE